MGKILRLSIILVLIILFPAYLSAEIRMKATGHDWLNYSTEEKELLTATMFTFYKLDTSEYSLHKAVEILDTQYYLAEKENNQKNNEFLSVPCLLNFGSILNDKKSEWGEKAIRHEK